MLDKVLSELVCYLSSVDTVNSIILGGSRSKGRATPHSDYDLFLLIRTDQFESFTNDFIPFLEDCSLIDVASYYNYVENWGYIYKAIGKYNKQTILLDIAILPLSRAAEMSLRSSNAILLDKNNIVKDIIEKSSGKCYDPCSLEPQRRLDYVKLFGFEYLRLSKSSAAQDYWLSLKCIERMKAYYLHYRRILDGRFANNQHCPEKGFYAAFPQVQLQHIFLVDGDHDSLKETGENLFQAFYDMITEKYILDLFIEQSKYVRNYSESHDD